MLNGFVGIKWTPILQSHNVKTSFAIAWGIQEMRHFSFRFLNAKKVEQTTNPLL